MANRSNNDRIISKAHRFSSNQGKVGWQDRTIPKRKKKHPSFRPSNGSFVTTLNEATSKYLRRRVWEREAKSSRFQTNIEISGVESWLGPSSTTNGSGKLGLETIHLVHFQNYGEQELLPPREISHGILEPSSSSSSSSRMDASRWFIERKFRFALLSYPFNCSPPSSWGSGRIWCKVFGEKLRRGKKWFAVFDRVIITGGKCGDLFRNTLVLWREFSLGKLGPLTENLFRRNRDSFWRIYFGETLVVALFKNLIPKLLLNIYFEREFLGNLNASILYVE